MTVEEILLILDSLAKYISYFYPGYVTVYVYNFLKAFTVNETKGVIFKSIAISFLYKTCIDSLQVESLFYYHLTLFFVSVVVPYICYSLQKTEIVLKAFEKLGINTRFETNEIDILDNGEYSAKLRVYLENERVMYEGLLGEKELEPNKKQFIILKQFKKYIVDKDGYSNKSCIESYANDEDKVLLFYEKINRIEKISREIEKEP